MFNENSASIDLWVKSLRNKKAKMLWNIKDFFKVGFQWEKFLEHFIKTKWLGPKFYE